MKRRNRHDTKEFKEEAISLALNSPSIGQTAKDLGIPEGTLHTWMHAAKKVVNNRLSPQKVW